MFDCVCCEWLTNFEIVAPRCSMIFRFVSCVPQSRGDFRFGVCGIQAPVEHCAFLFAANESRACSTIEAISHDGGSGVSPAAEHFTLQPMTCRGQGHSGANTSAFGDVVGRRLHTHGQRGVAKHRCGRWSIVAARQFRGNVALL